MTRFLLSLVYSITVLILFDFVKVNSSKFNFECDNRQCDNKIRQKYEPNWKSLDKRPLPQWYDDAKVGIFLHWGVYSVPSYGSEWFWTNWQGQKIPSYIDFMKNNYRPGFTYQEFAKEFTAELFNSTQWALLFQDSGAKYVVLTSKHHDGFALWPSSRSFSWNSKDVGPGIDIIGELSTAIREKTSIRFGLYYSLFEWFNRLYVEDKLHIFLENKYVQDKVLPELRELVELYGPEVIWSDGDWEAPPPYWNSTDFIAWLYNESPVRDTVVTNDRWGFATHCLHGDFWTCSDRYNPGVLQPHKWENAFTLDKTSWGQRYDTTLADYMTSKELIKELVTTVSCGGNILVNVGPTKYGTILPIFEERLRDMGKWLRINGEAIYGTKPWAYQNDTVTPGVWYTSNQMPNGGTNVYAIILDYPYDSNEIDLFALHGMVDGTTKISLLGMPSTTIKWSLNKSSLHIKMPGKHLIDKNELDFAWTFKITI
ncbi:putative alpha-L-fucosidase [Eupeodes corollae]|uniref:putative alpha-L-fucosidase n=1 Tax=Eupeodes corollae TaxID=290404 RepID=UPI002491BDA8|nr:putative alpha-L-fucosidase [Eupeodes corollae]